MTAIEKVGLLDSNNTLLNSDYDFSAFELRLTNNTWGVLFDDVDVKTEFDLSWTSGDVTISAWNAIIVATRATSTPIPNKKIAVRYQLSDTKTLTGTGTKIYIELDQTLIDDPTLIEDTYPSTDYALGKNIGELKRANDRPTTNPYIKLWEYDWAWNDLRTYPEIDGKKIDSNVVKLTGNQTIGGEKTFLVAPKAPTPTENDDLTTKEYVDDNILGASSPSALYEKWLIAGEDLDAGDSVFVEDMVTFSSADQAQAIGNATANTRVSIPAFGSGIAGNSLKLSLRKYVSPSVDLWIRIETDNAGEPSWTLFDADATATVTSASLTTSLLDTTIILAWNITIPKGQKVHIVLFAGTYGSETINGTNYFGVGYRAIDTTTRRAKTYDGADWSAGQATRFYYATSSLFTPKLLSKTDAKDTYKLPTDYPRLVSQDYTAGEEVTSTYFWLVDYPWLVDDTVYFVWDVPWTISAVPGSNPYMIWYTNNDGKFVVWFREYIVAWTDNTAVSLPTEMNARTNTYVVAKSAILSTIDTIPWIYRISFEHYTDDKGFARLLINGVEINERSKSGQWFITITEDVLLKNWDIVVLEHRSNTTGKQTTIINFLIRYNIIPNNRVITVTNTVW